MHICIHMESKSLTWCSLIFMLKLLIKTVFPLISTPGTYFMSKPQGEVVVRGQHLKVGGTYFKKTGELFKLN